LKSILNGVSVANVDAFKMDIEGSECAALDGYPEFAKRHTLVWAFIETNTVETKRCVKAFADSNKFKIAEPWTNDAVMTRNRQWILKSMR